MKAIITNVSMEGIGLRVFWTIDNTIEKQELFNKEVTKTEIINRIKATKEEYEDAEKKAINFQDLIGKVID